MFLCILTLPTAGCILPDPKILLPKTKNKWAVYQELIGNIKITSMYTLFRHSIYSEI